jgi:hypothetical protein
MPVNTLPARFSAKHNNAVSFHANKGFPSMNQQQRFVQSTQWLRPVTRWATRFSLNAPQWLPAPLRHAPLRLTSLVLKAYHRVLR